MKKSFRLLLAAGLAVVLAAACNGYDDSELRGEIDAIKGRVSKLEEQVQTANKNIADLQTITTVLNGAIFIKEYNELSDGYELKLSNNKTVTLTNGKNGNDGKSPVIGVKQDTDGIYYWTLDGQWLTGTDGGKLRVTGAQGADGVTPQMNIVNGLWQVSTDGGQNWTVLGPAQGAQGEQGATGPKGDSFFKEVYSDDDYVYMILEDDTKLALSRGTAAGAVALAVIPDYSNGAVKATTGEFDIRFDVVPESAAIGLASLSTEAFKFSVAYTLTKAAGDIVQMPVVAKNATTDGRLILTVDGTNLAYEFLNGLEGASAAISLVYGGNGITSGYFPLKLENKLNGHEYVDLGLSVKWATYNVGATKPEEFGDFFAWAETEPYYTEGHSQDSPCTGWRSGIDEWGYWHNNYKWMDHEWENHGIGGWWYAYTKYSFADGLTDGRWYTSNLFTGDNGDGVEHKTLADYDYEDDAARVKWGGTWRIPTPEEIQELVDQCDWELTDDYNGTGVRGMIVTSKKSGYTDVSIFLPEAHMWDGDSWSPYYPEGNYWSSSLDDTGSDNVCCLHFEEATLNYHGLSVANRFAGQNIRPVTE